jgi:hypothetical protein
MSENIEQFQEIFEYCDKMVFEDGDKRSDIKVPPKSIASDSNPLESGRLPVRVFEEDFYIPTPIRSKSKKDNEEWMDNF